MAGNRTFLSPHTFLGSQQALARFVGRPVSRFLAIEAAGGIMLLAATAVALVWANASPGSYADFWGTEVTLRIGDFVVEEDLRHWVNDGLMTIFFFVVGLEIKRELVGGELQSPRVAALPAIAALGGMIVPALIYLALNLGGEGETGWGIPMATDIAFALGVVALLGSRVPPPLKVFILTLAIVDDIGAILVIAVFYTSDLALGWLALGIGLIGLMYAMRRFRVWYFPVYWLVGFLAWFAFLESGVHATIAGVIIGLITPTTALQSQQETQRVVQDLQTKARFSANDLREASFYIQESVPVGLRLETALHPWSSYVVVPIFALANAGILLTRDALSDAASSPITWGVVLGLLVGKMVGVGGFALVATRIGLCELPRGVRGRHMTGAAALAGIGFTVSLFITQLAFDDLVLQDEAKIGVLVASALAAVIGASVLFGAGAGESRADAPYSS